MERKEKKERKTIKNIVENEGEERKKDCDETAMLKEDYWLRWGIADK